MTKRSLSRMPARLQVTQYFPKAANSTSFKWKDYCPLVFHNLRDAFSIDNRDYLLSLTGDQCAIFLFSLFRL